jgi:hypothetical protein
MRNFIALLVLGGGIAIAAIMAFSYSGDESVVRNKVNTGAAPSGGEDAPSGCEQPVRATGGAALTKFVAQLNAHKAWRHQVRAIYGSGFTWASSREREVVCERAGIAKRCTVVARPCRG